MANLILGFPIYSDVSVTYTPVLSGGSWQAALPLTNLQNRKRSKVARSTNALATSTQFDVDLGVARDVRVLALIGHNLTAAATVRWSGGTTPGASDVYDSTALAMSFAGVTAEDRDGIDFAVVHVPAVAQNARYWRAEAVDTSNPAGFVESGRLVIAGGYQPAINASYGAKLGLRDKTIVSETDGGASTYDAKPVRRVCTFALNDMEQSEAFNSAWRLQRRLGKSGQLFFVFDPADTTLMHERSFLGVLEELTALEFAYHNAHNMGFQIVEDI